MKRSVQQARALVSARSTTFSRSASSKARDYLQVTHPDEPVPKDVQDLIAAQARVTLNTYARPSLMFTRGKGMKIYDTQDREYLDFSAGIAVNALGHADEGVVKVISEQASQLVHCSNLYHNEWSGRLAECLVNSTIERGGMGYPDPNLDAESSRTSSGLKVFFSNSGTEANEGALKIARKYGKTRPEKHEIVCFTDGFHGRSMGALSATMQEKYQAPFAPLIPGFKAGDLNDTESVQHLVHDNTCAVIVEPIQGEGGVFEANELFLRTLRKRCDEVGAALIYDEIQCGLGRTGKLWAHALFPTDCHPDILTMAKPLANGLPIGAILMRDSVAEVIKLGDHGTTFGGAPLQTRAGLHVLERISTPDFLEHVSEAGEHLFSRLSALADELPLLIAGPPRGRGLMLGLPCKSAELPAQILKACRERGLLLLSCGNNTLRFVPSLTVTKEEIDQACDILEAAMMTVSGQ